jgi:ATP-binding cassette, subfamily C, bacterial LapB
VQAVTIATVAAGAYAVTASLMTVGALSACIMLASRSLMPVSQLMGQFFRLKQILRTTQPLSAVLALPPEQGGDLSRMGGQTEIRGAFHLVNVSFAHAADAPPALSGMNLRIAAGERVAVIGKSGCGKSTLLKLLARLHEPSAGTIHLDGRDLKQVDPAALRRAVALLPQTAELFDATLEANLVAGLGEVDPRWFAEVADAAGILETARRHPAGFSLRAGPGGQSLSGGERQSAALARALMGRPRLLLLDEPTAAMDNEREARVVKALEAMLRDGAFQSTGLILATHRMPILKLATRIIWLESGRIIADGPKDEIFQKLGLAA